MQTGKQILIHVNGHDEPGITAKITAFLGTSGTTLLDIEQTVVMDHLSLHLLVESHKFTSEEIKKELAEVLQDFSLNLRTREVEGELRIPDPYNRFVTTIIANGVKPQFIAELTTALAKLGGNIDTIRKLNNGGLETIELVCSTRETVDLPSISETLLSIASVYPDVDLAVQRENLYRRSKRLIVFDMDSTLTQGEVIDELAEEMGCKAEMAELTRSAMEGKIGFRESITQRVRLLQGMENTAMIRVADRMRLTPGASTLIKVLRKLGFKIAVVSGGFDFFVQRLKEDLGLHYAFGNKLEFRDGKATGELEGGIVDAQRKADILELLAQQEGILLEQVIAIGDGANDVLMLKKAGLGIAFNAKMVTRKEADTAITQKGMTSILYLLGITDSEIEAMGYKVSARLHSQAKS